MTNNNYEIYSNIDCQKKNMAFTSKQLITSNNDLINYLKKIPKAFRLINKGKFIINFDKLHYISPKDISGKKMAIIVNSLHSENINNNDSNDNVNSVGHWILLLFNLQKKECLLIENLDYLYKNRMDIKQSIDMYCTSHNFLLKDFGLKSQNFSAKSCGFQIIYYLWFFAYNGLTKFELLKRRLKDYSLIEREKYILRRSYKLCKYGAF